MRTAIVGGTLLDGTGRDPVEQTAIVIAGNRIDAVMAMSDITESGLGEAEVIDVEGRFVLPGLINMHEHLTYREIIGRPSLALDDPVRSTVVAVRNALNALGRGWTTVCDMASPYGIAAKIRARIDAGDLIGPRVIAAGSPIAVTGGHATGSGVLCIEADGVDGIAAAVRANFRDGADFVKVMASHDPVCMPGLEQTRPEMSRQEIAAAFEVARSWGKLTMCHVMGSEAISNVLAADVDIIHHGTYLNEELAAEAVRRGTFFCPTSSAYERQTMNPLFQRGRPWAEAHDVLVAPHAESVRIAVAAGVTVVNGTDSTGSYAEDVALLRSAGMSDMESLLACTKNPAAALRLGSDVGTVEAGKKADLVVLDGDPLDDPYALQAVVRVVASGALFLPDELRIEGAEPATFVDHHHPRSGP